MQLLDLWQVQKARKGDTAAFGKLFERHSRRVYNLLLRLCGNAALAEDLTQETFLTAYERLPNWHGIGAFSTWLCGIAVKQNLAARRRTHVTESLDNLEISADSASDPLVAYTKQEATLALESAIAALPDSYREVFVLVRMQGMRYREVAALLEIPLGTVKSRLASATALLKRALTPRSEEYLPKGNERHAL